MELQRTPAGTPAMSRDDKRAVFAALLGHALSRGEHPAGDPVPA